MRYTTSGHHLGRDAILAFRLGCSCGNDQEARLSANGLEKCQDVNTGESLDLLRAVSLGLRLRNRPCL